MPKHPSPILKRALAATQSCYESFVRTGWDSEETEGWRDTCDELFHQLTAKEQKHVRAMERKLIKKG